MKQVFFISFLLIVTIGAFAQIEKVINKSEVERIEKKLSADDMEGRRTFTPGLVKAGNFIADEFKKAGLQQAPGLTGYKQEFTMVQPRLVSVSGSFDQQALPEKSIVVNTSAADLEVTEKSGFEKIRIKPGSNLNTEIAGLTRAGKNYLVLIDTSYAALFSRMAGRGSRPVFKANNSIVYVLSAADPKTYKISIKQEVKELGLSNIVGVIPGKSKRDEYVIFSAHYDHLGIGRPVDGDSIFNGANDDAAGSTAVIMLANYFNTLHNNERTLVFAAFCGEEVGGYGSQYFSRQFAPEKVAAMFNIEMIGTDSKWGKNSAYITGYEKTDMGKILEKNLQGTGFQFYPDPYTTQGLFYRSDNATLARLGVPAHTISTSKMDSEQYYHTVNDEIETLDMDNMAAIIRAIALSSQTIVSGKDTPSRVDTQQLR
ncbi:MAG: M28 family peptidase [Williamsia sp.]|nr:M28 family peptidase [Williamsia sp.]